jgi:DNA-binding transcriptional LysR family regulator
VEAVPQLGDNEEVLAPDNALLNGAGDSLSSFDFVAVVCENYKLVLFRFASQGLRTASAVKQTVSSLDGLVDLVSAGVVVHLPEAKAHDGHVIATAELDSGSSHLESGVGAVVARGRERKKVQ